MTIGSRSVFPTRVAALVLVSLLVAVVAGIRVESPPGGYQWADVRSWFPVDSVTGVDILRSPDHTAVIWQPADRGSALVYSDLTQPERRLELLPFADVRPARWRAVPAEDDTFHLIWWETSGRLLSAHIGGAGDTLRGPIQLAYNAQKDFVALPYQRNRALVLWLDADTRQIMATNLDSTGVFIHTPLHTRAAFLAAAADTTGMARLAWLSPSDPGAWDLSIATVDMAAPAMGTTDVLHTITLNAQESIASFATGLDATHTYVFWSVAGVAIPDRERLFMLSFPHGEPDRLSVAELTFPVNFRPERVEQPASPGLALLDTRVDDGDNPAALRWPYALPQQADVLPVILALRDDGTWRPAVLFLRSGVPIGFQVIAPDVLSTPPTLSTGADGTLSAAWYSVTGATPELVTASSESRGLVRVSNAASRDPSAAVRSGLVRLPAGLVWLLLPLAVLLATPSRQPWAFVLATVIYGITKTLLPSAMFRSVPDLVPIRFAELVGDSVTVSAMILFAAGLGMLGWAVLRRYTRNPWQEWLLFGLLDMLLCWAIFGSNLGTLL